MTASPVAAPVSETVRGFYAIIDRDDPALARTLLAHSRILQLRMKRAHADEIVRAGRSLRAVCDALGATFVMNDRVDLALACGAHAVHLGQTDLPLREARSIAPAMTFGVSTHDLDQVRRALDDGADYLGYGPVFATRTKENPDPVQGLDALRAAVELAGSVPIVAIGGITPETVASAYATGARAVCAIGAVLEHTEPGKIAGLLDFRASE